MEEKIESKKLKVETPNFTLQIRKKNERKFFITWIQVLILK